MKKGLSTILPVLIILIVGVIAVIGGYYYGVNSTATTTSLLTAARTTAPTDVTTTTTAVSIAGWKTYSNATDGFSFKYPAGWVLGSDQTAITTNSRTVPDGTKGRTIQLKNNEQNININFSDGNPNQLSALIYWNNIEESTLNDCYDKPTTKTDSTSGSISIAYINYDRAEKMNCVSNYFIGLVAYKNKIVHVSYPSKEDETVNQILSTFQFDSK